MPTPTATTPGTTPPTTTGTADGGPTIAFIQRMAGAARLEAGIHKEVEMKTTLDQRFQGVTPNGAVRALVRTLVDRLRLARPEVADCRVSMESLAKASPPGSGRRYRVQLEVRRASGGLLTIRRDARRELKPERLQTAVREAFAAAERALAGAPSAPPQSGPMLEGRVESLFGREGYGFVRTAGGKTLYFRAGAVQNRGFLRLAVGSRVRCEMVRGSLGHRARRVEILEAADRRAAEVGSPADLAAGSRTDRPAAASRPAPKDDGSAP